MEFLVEFEVNVPDGTPEHLVRLWKRPVRPGETEIVGLYRADSETELDGLLGALPLYDWMRVTVTPLEPHPNDPAAPKTTI
jgi:muconolactone D-isomerase